MTVPQRAPKRVKLGRRRGDRKPEGAVNCARPTKWGNPFKVKWVPERSTYLIEGPWDSTGCDFKTQSLATEVAVRLFEYALEDAIDGHGPQPPEFVRMAADLEELRGKDLACWCELPGKNADGSDRREPCHVDILLRFANREPES